MGHDPQRDVTVVVLTNLQFSRSGEEPADTIAKHLDGTLDTDGTASVPDAG